MLGCYVHLNVGVGGYLVLLQLNVLDFVNSQWEPYPLGGVDGMLVCGKARGSMRSPGWGTVVGM